MWMTQKVTRSLGEAEPEEASARVRAIMLATRKVSSVGGRHALRPYCDHDTSEAAVTLAASYCSSGAGAGSPGRELSKGGR